jgi:hypothetical protein
MKTIPQQLSRLQAFVMVPYNGEQPLDATVRVCVLCGAEARVQHPCADVDAEIAKTIHDPSCLYDMLCKATIWVAGSEDWNNPAEADHGFRFFPATALSSAAKVMARKVSSHEAWTDDDGTFYPDGRKLFMVLDLPMPPEFTAAYEAEKRAGERRARRVEWERAMEDMDRMRRRAVGVLTELNLDGELDEQVRAKVEAAYPYPPEPDMGDE